MNTNDRLEELLTRFRQGETDLDCTRKAVQDLFFSDLGHTRLDTNRGERTGYPEVIYCAGKNGPTRSGRLWDICRVGASTFLPPG